jgi:hypothetical protein
MSKNILSLLFFGTAVAVFVLWTQPYLDELNALKAEKGHIDTALAEARKLQELNNDLLSKFNSISSEDISRLYKMIPGEPEDIKLMIWLSGAAQRTGVIIKSLKVNEPSRSSKKLVLTPKPYKELDLDIGFSSSYESLQFFINELEKNLRLIDIVQISFTAGETNLYEFVIKAKLYFKNETNN